jgi:transcriptional regulator with XRE-family HTH domain
MLTGAQIRMARAYLKWSAKELAQKAGVGYSTIQRMELEDGVPAASAKNVQAVQHALENAGVSFSTASDTISVAVSRRQ